MSNNIFERMNSDNIEISKEWLGLKFSSIEELIQTKLDAIEEARKLALHSMEKRLDGMNEFRQSLNDMQGTFLTRDMYDSKHSEIIKEIDELKIFKAVVDSKATRNSVIYVAILGALGFILGVAGLIINLMKSGK